MGFGRWRHGSRRYGPASLGIPNRPRIWRIRSCLFHLRWKKRSAAEHRGRHEPRNDCSTRGAPDSMWSITSSRWISSFWKGRRIQGIEKSFVWCAGRIIIKFRLQSREPWTVMDTFRAIWSHCPFHSKVPSWTTANHHPTTKTSFHT